MDESGGGFQLKKSRLDSLSSKIAKTGQTRPTERRCKMCGLESPTDVCGTCRKICSVCNNVVQPIATFNTCTVCKRWIHADCVSVSEDDELLDDFACPRCRKSPLLLGGDAMLPASSASADADDDDDADGRSPSACAEEEGASRQSGGGGGGGPSGLGDPFASGRSSPTTDSLDPLNFTLGPLAAGPSTLSESSITSTDSARNSPSFCPDPNSPVSDGDEEFRPGRGGGSSRGGRAGKKKPGGRGGATLMKTRSGGKPPSGVFSDRLGKSERGKRGKARGASKGGGKGGGVGTRGSGRGRGGGRGGGGGGLIPSNNFPFIPQQILSGLSGLCSLASLGAASALAAGPGRIMGGGGGGGPGPIPGSAGGLLPGLVGPVHDPTEEALMGVIGGGPSHSGESRARSDDEYVRTIVVEREDDEFLSTAPLCLVCGSVGKGAECSMIACSVCAHTYHTYCVGLHEKINNVVVSRGWRCLDCAVCEGCGENSDEGKLLMCQECDVSYHIYCLNPPLDRIPTGTWRCQWCAKCRRCQMRVPSNDLSKEGLCQACLSLRKCPKCNKLYQLNDNIIRCSSCMRWCHGHCENLLSAEQLESAALNKMRCSECRPNSRTTNYSTNDVNIMVVDNVALNNCAEVLQSKFFPPMFRANSFDGSGTTAAFLNDLRSSSIDGHFGGSVDDDGTPDETDFGSLTGLLGTGMRGGRGGGRGGAGRGRMPKLGVGGFFVKVPRHRWLAAEEEAAEIDADGNKKVKRQRKPRRSQLEDAYPSQIQEGFFGMRAIEGKALMDVEMAEPSLQDYARGKRRTGHLRGDVLGKEASESLRSDLNEASLLENMNLNEYMNIDDVNLDDLFGDDEEFDTNLSDAFDIVQNDMDLSRSSSTQPAIAPDSSNDGMNHSQSSMPGGMSVSSQQHHPHPSQQQQHMQQQPGAMHQSQPGQMLSQMPGGAGGMLKGGPGKIHRAGSQMGEGGTERQTGNSNAATERWEEDEPLGDKATKAAVLYVNINDPNLRARMPEWSERAKYIHRVWRSLEAEQRQKYVQMARENRAAREKVPRPRGPRVQQAAAVLTAESSTGAALAMQMASGQPVGALSSGLGGLTAGAGGGVGGGPGQQQALGQGPSAGLAVPFTGQQPGPMGGVQPQPAGMPGATNGASGDFKVPAVPPQATPQQPSLDHLSPELRTEYAETQKARKELEDKVETVETDLNRMRKMKKNLTAKRRTKMKSAGDAAAVEGYESLDATDKEHLDSLTKDVPEKQKELENVKRDLKNHVAAMHDFELKHQIRSEEMLAAQQQQQAMQQGQQLPMQQGGPMMTSPMHPGMHPGGSAASVAAAQMHPGMAARLGAGPPGGPPMGGSTGGPGGPGGPYQQLVVPQQMTYSQIMGERGFPLGAVPPHGMRPPMMAGRPMMGRWPMRPVLGSVHYDQLRTQEEREVYECMDAIVERISFEIDGPPSLPPHAASMSTGSSLKRMLEPLPHAAMMMGGAAGMGLDEVPKPKKKRQMQKKNVGTGGNEYESALERLRAALTACERMPKRALEPAPRNEPAPFAVQGMGDLSEKYERSMVGQPMVLGRLQLPFVDDVYGDVRKISLPPPVSMAALCPNARMSILERMCGMQPALPEMVRDEKPDAKPGHSPALIPAPSTTQGGEAPCADVIRPLVAPLEGPRPLLRWSAKVADVPRMPVEPHRIAFTKSKKEEEEAEEEVEVCLELVERADMDRAALARHVLENLASLIDIKQPIEDYQLDTPPRSPSVGDSGPSTAGLDVKPSLAALASCASSSSMRPSTPSLSAQAALSGRCRHCERDMVLANSVRQSMSQLGLTPSDDGKDDTVSFCSMKCYYMFVASAKVALSHEQLQRAEGHCDEATYNRLKQISAESFARCINQAARPSIKLEPSTVPLAMNIGGMVNGGPLIGRSISSTSVPPTPTSGGPPLDITSPKDTRYLMEEGRRDNVHVIRELAQSAKMGVEIVDLPDSRVCTLCGHKGDGDTPNSCGRLLSYDALAWVHVNCALWSSEVYETPNGALVNVDRAVIRGVSSFCHLCNRPGATVQCFKAECLKNFHFACATQIYGRFLKDKNFMCPNHYDVHSDAYASLDPLRRLYIERDENKLLTRLFDSSEPPRLVLRLGAFTFRRLGQLLPEQLKTCHSSRFIFPIGFTASRLFWSITDMKKRARYALNISERDGCPQFNVTLADGSHAWHGRTANDAFKEVFEAVARLRSRGDLLRFFPSAVPAEHLYGLGEAAVTKMTESLPGVDSLYSYTFRHGGAPVLELPLAENPSGCARCEPRMRTLIKRRKTAPSSGKSGGGSGASGEKRGALYADLIRAYGRLDPFAPGLNKYDYGVTEQSYSAYQKMRKEWRNTVYLARSKIQGLGLYAKRDIDMGAMIIEYKGEVIRAEVGEMREKRYFAQNRGTYMFRVSEEMIIDATMKGGPARYINHSCDPNCATHIMCTGEDKKIIITANRPIKAEEELTYDYQFDIEDDSEKVACLCGAPNCQRWMN